MISSAVSLAEGYLSLFKTCYHDLIACCLVRNDLISENFLTLLLSTEAWKDSIWVAAWILAVVVVCGEICEGACVGSLLEMTWSQP